MNKMCLAHLGALLVALHLLSSQVVLAQTVTGAPMNTTMNATMNTTMTPNVTMNATTTGDKNGCGSNDGFTLLLSLAIAASLLHGWSQ